MTRRVSLVTLIFPFLFISSMHASIFTRENDLHTFTYVSQRSAIQCTRWWCGQKENKRKTHIPLMCNLSQVELARSQMVVIYRKWPVLYHHGNRIDRPGILNVWWNRICKFFLHERALYFSRKTHSYSDTARQGAYIIGFIIYNLSPGQSLRRSGVVDLSIHRP